MTFLSFSFLFEKLLILSSFFFFFFVMVPNPPSVYPWQPASLILNAVFIS